MHIVIIPLLTCMALASHVTDFGHISGGEESFNPTDTGLNLYEQPYNFAALTNGLYCHSSGGNACADNFQLSMDATLEMVTFWTVHSSTHPNDMSLAIYEDSGSFMGTMIWSDTVSEVNITETFTDDQSWGLDLWRIDLQLEPDQYVNLTAGQQYWLYMTVLNSTGPDGWLVCDPTYTLLMWQYDMGSWWQMPYDAFFGLSGCYLALESETWGNIKGFFR